MPSLALNEHSSKKQLTQLMRLSPSLSYKTAAANIDVGRICGTLRTARAEIHLSLAESTLEARGMKGKVGCHNFWLATFGRK